MPYIKEQHEGDSYMLTVSVVNDVGGCDSLLDVFQSIFRHFRQRLEVTMIEMGG